MALHIFLVLSLVFSTSHALVQDFCVADLSAKATPAGYPCKEPSQVVVEDFMYSGLGVAGNTSNTINAAITPAFVTQFPGLNGLGIAMGRVDFAPGGVVPLHAHPRATEVLLVTQGTVLCGLISSIDNKPYFKTVKEGDIFVFPPGLLHFQVNVGKTNALTFVAFSNPNPGLQIADYALFANNLPSDIIEQITFIDDAEIQRLKKLFGSTTSKKKERKEKICLVNA